MTPLQFAQHCAKKYELPKLQHEALVKGPGHEPREVVDRRKPLMALLQVCRICTERRGGVRPFTLTRIVQAYRMDLLSAGLDPDGGEVRCVLSRSRWNAVKVLHRLTGEFPRTDPIIARRVAGILKSRETRLQNELTAAQSTINSQPSTAQESAADHSTVVFMQLDEIPIHPSPSSSPSYQSEI